MHGSQLSLEAVRQDLEHRRAELARLGALVNGAAMVDELLTLLDGLDAPETEREPLLTLSAAARESGFSPDHLGRLVKRGHIPNHGRPRAPRVRLSECPRKRLPAACRPKSSNAKFSVATGARPVSRKAVEP